LKRLFLAAAILLYAAPAQAGECPAQAVKVGVSLDYTAPKEDTSLRAAVIAAGMKEEKGDWDSLKRDHAYNGVTLGFTQASEDIKIENRKAPDGKNYCPTVTEANFTFTYAPSVYIATELASLPCLYNVTAAHEKKHYEKTRQTIEEFIPKMKQALERHFKKTPPAAVPAGKVPAARYKIKEGFLNAISIVMEDYAVAERKAQDEIDPPEIFLKDSVLCSGEFLFPEGN